MRWCGDVCLDNVASSATETIAVHKGTNFPSASAYLAGRQSRKVGDAVFDIAMSCNQAFAC